MRFPVLSLLHEARGHETSRSGDYELHFASYSDSDNDGKLEFEGLLNVTSKSDLNLLNISVSANAEVNLNILVSGFLNI